MLRRMDTLLTRRQRIRRRAQDDWGNLRPKGREVVPEALAVVAAAVVAATRGASLGQAVLYGLVAAVVVVALWAGGSYAVSYVGAVVKVVSNELDVLTSKIGQLEQAQREA